MTESIPTANVRRSENALAASRMVALSSLRSVASAARTVSQWRRTLVVPFSVALEGVG